MTINEVNLKNAYDIVFEDIARKLIKDNYTGSDSSSEQIKNEIKKRLFHLLESDDLFDIVQLHMIAADVMNNLV